MSLSEIARLSGAEIVEAHRPWGTHFIGKRGTDLWLDIEDDGLQAVQLITVDGRRFMATRSTPKRNLCSGRLFFFLRVTWSAQLLGADVFLNGRKLEPDDWNGTLLELPAGHNEIRFEKEGWEPVVKTLQLDPEDRGDPSIDLTAESLRPVGS